MVRIENRGASIYSYEWCHQPPPINKVAGDRATLPSREDGELRLDFLVDDH